MLTEVDSYPVTALDYTSCDDGNAYCCNAFLPGFTPIDDGVFVS